MKVVNIVTGLDRNGAEMVLWELSKRLVAHRHQVVVISSAQEGELVDDFRAAGVRVRTLSGNRFRWRPARIVANFLQLVAMTRAERPDAVHTLMYGANLTGGVAARIARPRVPVFWSIHHSQLVAATTTRREKMINKLSALLSPWVPAGIVYLGTRSRAIHEADGYDSGKARLIPNGVDTDRFRPDPIATDRLRRQLSIPESRRIVGYFGRYHGDKDIPNLLRAISRYAGSTDAPAHFVLCGRDLDPANEPLVAMLRTLGIEHMVHLLGIQPQPERIMPGFDLLTLPSRTESLPLVLLEAMACGVPCVATDVGEVADVLAGTGIVVPAQDPDALAAGWHRVLELEPDSRKALGMKARSHVQENYSLETFAARYIDLFTGASARASADPGEHRSAPAHVAERPEAPLPGGTGMRVLIAMAGLERGGAERQAVELATNLVRRGHVVTVWVPYAGQFYERQLAAAGVEIIRGHATGRPVAASGMPWVRGRVTNTLSLVRALRAGRFDVVYTFESELGVLSTLAGPLHRTPIIWGVRHSNPGAGILTPMLETVLSRSVAQVIANSEAGKRVLLRRRFPSRKVGVIQNGINTERFRIDPAWRRERRAEFGLSDETYAIGVVGRLAPSKDHENFLRAARIVAQAMPSARFLVVGQDQDGRLAHLKALSRELGISDRIIWTGVRADVEEVMNALDLCVLSSVSGEGFPNVVAEALACGTPCVATDVGDAALIVDAPDLSVPVEAPELLADAILEQVRRGPGCPEQRRRRIVALWGVDSMVDKTERLLLGLRPARREPHRDSRPLLARQ